MSAVSDSRIQFKRSNDSRTISLSLKRGEISLQPLVEIGEKVRVGQIIASVVPVSSSVPRSTTSAETAFVYLLSSSSVADRYAAAKALGHIASPGSFQPLVARINDESEHIYDRGRYSFSARVERIPRLMSSDPLPIGTMRLVR